MPSDAAGSEAAGIRHEYELEPDAQRSRQAVLSGGCRAGSATCTLSSYWIQVQNFLCAGEIDVSTVCYADQTSL
jgi:hypothetical protein